MRITTQEIFAVTLLAPMLRELHERHPEILIELDDSQDFRDLGEGEADIALRSAAAISAPELSAGGSAIDDWTLYCSREYAAEHGVPTHPRRAEEACLHRWRRSQALAGLLGLAA